MSRHGPDSFNRERVLRAAIDLADREGIESLCMHKLGQEVGAYSVLDSYIYGFTPNELSLPFDTSEEVAEVAGNILRDSAAGEYPYLAEMAIDRVIKAGYDYGDEFEFGLDLILDGL